ncbi:hypothetical protein GGF42_005919 [Coemansia sp. RSA 2424]|nr:hypothetical protein GGF42_005919 [Coemansia sp. RSA 2424]
MPLSAISSDDADIYTTRDRLVVLSLAAALGAKDWDKNARMLNSSFQSLPSDSSREYTHNDCVRIYQDAIKRAADSGCVGDDSARLYQSLCSLKGRRLDEIQARLEHIALAIEDLGTHADSADSAASLLESSAAGVDTRQSEDQITISKPLHIASHDADTSRRQVGEMADSGILAKDEPVAEEHPVSAAELTPELEDKLSEIDREPERVTATVLAMRPLANAVESHDHVDNDTHSETSAASKPQRSPVAMSFSDDGDLKRGSASSESGDASDAGETNTALSLAPGRCAVELELKPRVGDTDDDTVAAADTEAGGMEGSGAGYDQSRVLVPASSSGAKAAAPTLDEQQMRNWKKNINTVWRDISGHRLGSMFINPIKSADAPNYYEVIRQPLDLKTIKNRIRDEEITTTVEFYRDIMHMLMNALMYNAEDSEVYQMTMEIIPDAQACIEQLLQTEAAVNQPKAGGANAAVTDDDDDDDDTSAILPAPASVPAAGAAASAIATEALKSGDDESSRAGEVPLLHEADDSDSSVPTKRRRRVASERASKHLRA